MSRKCTSVECEKHLSKLMYLCASRSTLLKCFRNYTDFEIKDIKSVTENSFLLQYSCYDIHFSETYWLLHTKTDI